jgi:LEA14-like dessication related protein
MKITIPKTLAVTIALSALLLAGCAGVGSRIESPRISLANIQVQKFTGFETVFQIDLRVFNSNDVDLDIKGIEADLEINAKPFATGVSKTDVKIPSFETQIVPVTLYSSVIDIVKGIHGLHKTEKLAYRLTGKLRVTGDNLLTTSLPFESEGQVTVDEFKEQEQE